MSDDGTCCVDVCVRDGAQQKQTPFKRNLESESHANEDMNYKPGSRLWRPPAAYVVKKRPPESVCPKKEILIID